MLQALDRIPGGADTYREPGDPALLGKGFIEGK